MQAALARMHEVGIMREVLATALREAARHGASRVVRLHLRIGDLSGVVPDALELAFEVLRQGTPAEHAALSCERVAAAARCTACDARFAPAELPAQCPACGAVSLDVTGGRELSFDSIEME